MNWREGLQIVNFTTTKSGKRKKLKVKTVTGNLDKFYQFLFGKGVSANNIKSFEEVYKLFKGRKFRFPKKIFLEQMAYSLTRYCGRFSIGKSMVMPM